ncbi:MAG: glycine zipper 2TM domain-containing protein [Xanthomonadaceae bacterium]|nr:glycine zipper 2TM domain-containing protein [Xanthomonadaceae bacterium]
MKTIAVTALFLAIAACFSGPSSAQSNSNDRNYVSENSRRAVARVTRVERTQRDSQQRQECWNERTNKNDSGYYRDGSGHLYRGDGSNKTARTVIGAIVGGALGTQVGGGDGRTAATIAGAAIGAAVGGNTGGNNRYEGYDRYRDGSGTERHCRNIGNYDSRDLGLYRVSYSYAGIAYQTTTDFNPGRTLRVLVDVRPEE